MLLSVGINQLSTLTACSRQTSTWKHGTYAFPETHIDGAVAGSGLSGVFNAGRVRGQVCAWVGLQHPMTWPRGYRVRLDPVQLPDPSGHVVVTAGQLLSTATDGPPATKATVFDTARRADEPRRRESASGTDIVSLWHHVAPCLRRQQAIALARLDSSSCVCVWETLGRGAAQEWRLYVVVGDQRCLPPFLSHAGDLLPDPRGWRPEGYQPVDDHVS